MESKECACCSKRFHPRPQSPNQIFCSSPACQRERRRRWQRKRRQDDPAYQDNQTRVQASWAERHPAYWREYRGRHPEYAERNRVLQAKRDARRRERGLAKMDLSTPELPISSGIYRLSPATRADLAKMDVWTVQITVVSKQYAQSG